MRNLLVVLFLVTACSAYLYGATEEQTLHKTYELSRNGFITLKNVHGDVTIRAWDKNEVDLTATKRGDARELDLVEIAIDSTPEHFDVESKYPRFHNNVDVSVTYELTVPRGSTLDDVSNVNGGVDIVGIEGRIDASTVNGSVHIDGARSAVHAESVNGSVHSKWAQFPEKGEIVMESVNGRLELQLPQDVNADVQAKSLNGSIHSDYPITVHNAFLSHKLEGKIGNGGVSIELKTVNGSINIIKN